MTDEKKPKRGLRVVDPQVDHQVKQMCERGELKPVIGKRCRICRDEGLRHLVNDLLAHGHGYPSILRTLEPVNARRPADRQITKDCLYMHRREHFDLQEPARSAWRRVLEARATDQGLMADGVTDLVDSAAFFEVMLKKGFETLVAADTQVSVQDGAWAAKQLHELMRTDAGVEQMARMQAQMNRIVAVMRELPPDQQQWVLSRLDGTETPALPAEVVGDDEEETDDEDLGGYDDDED